MSKINHGAQGICAARLSEAEVMLTGGVDDVLITTPIANPVKSELLAPKDASFQY